MPKTRILFDGNCVVCDLEISHYARVAPDQFELVDISAPDFDAVAYGFTRAAVERDLHVITPKGEVRIGVDAFAHIWSRVGRYRWTTRIITFPPVRALARAGYYVFTILRPYLPKKRR